MSNHQETTTKGLSVRSETFKDFPKMVREQNKFKTSVSNTLQIFPLLKSINLPRPCVSVSLQLKPAEYFRGHKTLIYDLKS